MTQVFISYARDDGQVSRAALRLAERLRADGVDAHLDEWDLAPGDRIAEFMERSVHDSGAVIFGCCPTFKAKADNPRGGVGVEASHARARDYESNLSARFFPVVLAGSFDDAVPRFLRPRRALDFTTEMRWLMGYPQLLRALRGLPPAQPPVLPPPSADRADASEILADFERAFASASPTDGARSSISRYPFVLNALRTYIHFFPDFDFGGEMDPDLVFAGWGNYTVWSLVALASPNAPVFTEEGLLSPELEAAVARVRGWTVWNSQDVDRDTTADFRAVTAALAVEAFVVIGRRSSLGSNGLRRLAQLNLVAGDRPKVVTYDTLLEFIGAQPTHSLYHFQGEWLARAGSAARPADIG